jgi:hypothetical protein
MKAATTSSSPLQFFLDGLCPRFHQHLGHKLNVFGQFPKLQSRCILRFGSGMSRGLHAQSRVPLRFHITLTPLLISYQGCILLAIVNYALIIFIGLGATTDMDNIQMPAMPNALNKWGIGGPRQQKYESSSTQGF